MSPLNRRNFLSTTIAAGVTTSLTARTLRAANANDEINLGFISCGGRAGQLMGQFSKVDGINIAGLCDADEKRLGLAKQTSVFYGTTTQHQSRNNRAVKSDSN